MVLKRNGTIEIYSIEIKKLRNVKPRVIEEALNPNKLRSKWENCLKETLKIISKINSVSQGKASINTYIVLATPDDVRWSIATLIRRRGMAYKPRIPDAGRIEGRILPCNNPVTGNSHTF